MMYDQLYYYMQSFPANKYMPKVNNTNSRKSGQICLKLTTKTQEKCH